MGTAAPEELLQGSCCGAIQVLAQMTEVNALRVTVKGWANN